MDFVFMRLSTGEIYMYLAQASTLELKFLYTNPEIPVTPENSKIAKYNLSGYILDYQSSRGYLKEPIK